MQIVCVYKLPSSDPIHSPFPRYPTYLTSVSAFTHIHHLICWTTTTAIHPYLLGETASERRGETSGRSDEGEGAGGVSAVSVPW